MMENIEARMGRWAAWCVARDGATLGYPRQSPSCRMMARTSANMSTPEIDGEAYDTELAVQELPVILREVVRECYVATGTIESQCKRLGISYKARSGYLGQALGMLAVKFAKNYVDGVRRKRI